MRKVLIIFIIFAFFFSCKDNQKEVNNKKLSKNDIPILMKNIEQKLNDRNNIVNQNYYWINSVNGLELRNIKSHKKISIIPQGEKVKLIKSADFYTDVDGIIDLWDVVEWNGKKGFVLNEFLSKNITDKSLSTELYGKWINEKKSYYIEFKKDSTYETNLDMNEEKQKRTWKYNDHKKLIEIKAENSKDVQLFYVDSISHYGNGLVNEISLLDLNYGGIIKFICSTTLIHEAVKDDDLEKFKETITSNDDFMIEAAYGIKPTQMAAKYGSIQIIEYMNEKYDYSYLFTDRTDNDESTIHFAVLGGKNDVVDYLIEKEVSIDQQDKGGYTPLHYAIILGNNDLVIKLVEEGANVARSNKEGFKPAQLAVLYNKPEILKTLLYYGAKKENNDYYGINDSLLHMCFYSYKKVSKNNEKKKYKNPELPELKPFSENEIINMFKILLDDNTEINIENNRDQTILHYAAMGGSKSILEKILEYDTEYKLDLDGLDKDDYAPIHYAAINNNMEALQFLIKKGANVNPSKNHETPLWVALDNTSDEAADLLVKNGADLIHDYYDEKSLLHKAVDYDKYKVIRGLLKRNADINHKDKNGDTPLHYAIDESEIKSVKILLEYKADVKIKNNNGDTPLHTAGKEYSKEILKLILEYYKDVNIKNNKGNTPLHLAAGNGRADNVKILLDAGAKLNIKNNDGKDVAEYLESVWMYSDKRRKVRKVIEEAVKKREGK